VAERDELIGALGGEDAGRPRRRQGFPLVERAAEDRVARGRARAQQGPRDGHPRGHRLVLDVDHGQAALGIDVGQACRVGIVVVRV
jgi:hypothetical protein